MFGDKLLQPSFLYRQDDSFVIRNQSVNPRQIALFASNWVFTVFPALVVPRIISGNEASYDELIGDKEVNPKKILGIRLGLFGTTNQNIDQLSKPLTFYRREPNGQMVSFSDYPLSLLPLDQFQTGIVEMYYEGLILGLNEYVVLNMNAQTEIRVTVIYDDYGLNKLLKRNARRVLYESKTD